MLDKAIEFISFDGGNFVIKTLQIQQGLILERDPKRPTNAIRTGAGTLIKQKLKYNKTDFNLNGTSNDRNLSVYLQNLYDNDFNFVMNIYYKDGDIITKGVRGIKAITRETFFCTLNTFTRDDDINENTYNIEAEILEI